MSGVTEDVANGPNDDCDCGECERVRVDCCGELRASCEIACRDGICTCLRGKGCDVWPAAVDRADRDLAGMLIDP